MRIVVLSGSAPVGTLEGPSPAIADDKHEFGTSRILRWFGRAWNEEEPARA